MKKVRQEQGLVAVTVHDVILNGAARVELQATKNQYEMLAKKQKIISVASTAEVSYAKMIRDARAKLKETPEWKELDRAKKLLKESRRVKDKAIIEYSAIHETILADFEPGLSLPDKLAILDKMATEESINN